MGIYSEPQHLERHQAFLNRGPSDRALVGCNIGFFMHESFPTFIKQLPPGPVTPEMIQVEPFLQDCERLYQAYRQLDDDYPFIAAAFVYVPWTEAIMGCPIATSGKTMWAEPCVSDWETWHWKKPVLDDNPWAQKLLELTQALVERSQGRYPVAPTLMRGPADMLSAMRGASRFVMDFFDCPDAMRHAAALCAETWIELGQTQLRLVAESKQGYFAGAHGLRFWAPDKAIWLQEDAMALLSPKIFRQFILPVDDMISKQFPYVAFHLHGSALWAVDDLVKLPGLAVIELNMEAARCDVEATFNGWREIQANKPLVIWGPYDPEAWINRVRNEFPASGLSIQVTTADLKSALEAKAALLHQP